MAEGKARTMASTEGEGRRPDEGEAGKQMAEGGKDMAEGGRQMMQEGGRQAAESTRRGMMAGQRGMEQGMEATMKVGDVSMEFYHDAMAFGRGNVDALVKANMIMAQGYQEIFKAMIGMAKEAMEDGLGRGAIDKIADRSTQISEIYMSMIEHAMEPISERFAAAADTMKQGTERQQRLGRESERR